MVKSVTRKAYLSNIVGSITLGNVFRSNLGQVSLSTARDLIVAMAKSIHDNFPEVLTQDVIYVVANIPRDDPEGLRVSGEIVDNTMSPQIFGAIILIEHYPCSIKGITGYVDFKLVLPEINDKPLITQDQVRIIEGDVRLLINIPTEIQKQISDEWNE